MTLNIGGFIICAAIILFAGKKLSFYGDLLAEKKGWGKAWVGLILMASVTSLPELMVGVSSSAFVESADLAVGDILGSCAFNLGILAMLDAFVPMRKPLFQLASPSHVMAATFGIILLCMVGFGLFLPNQIILTSWIGFSSLLFIVIYLLSIRIIYLYEKKRAATTALVPSADAKGSLTLKQVITWYVLFASIIIVSALALPYFADHIAEEADLDKSFVGTLFLAASTSLPEIAVGIAAVRMGSIDIAIGNLLGSNIFNILILAFDDFFYTKGNILKDASPYNLVSVFSVILMSAIAIVGLTYQSKEKRFKMAWDSVLIFIVYLVNIILLYYLNS
jgi:cation:H+ antiporter